MERFTITKVKKGDKKMKKILLILVTIILTFITIVYNIKIINVQDNQITISIFGINETYLYLN